MGGAASVPLTMEAAKAEGLASSTITIYLAKHCKIPSLIGPTILTKGGSQPTDTLVGKYIGLYFSAQSCPICQEFTQTLSETYKKLKSVGKEFEIVFASSDKDEEQFTEYFKDMPWTALPFVQLEVGSQHALSQQFEVSGIPALVILDQLGNVINKNGRAAVMGDKSGQDFPWRVTLAEPPSSAAAAAATPAAGTDSQITILEELAAAAEPSRYTGVQTCESITISCVHSAACAGELMQYLRTNSQRRPPSPHHLFLARMAACFEAR